MRAARSGLKVRDRQRVSAACWAGVAMKRTIVVGAGFGGMQAAGELDRLFRRRASAPNNGDAETEMDSAASK